MNHRFSHSVVVLAIAAFAALLGINTATSATPQHLSDRHAQAQKLYVASGSTGSRCTRSRPCSLVAAQKRVRELAPRMRSDIVVLMVGGIHHFASPLKLTPADSGHHHGHVVQWEGRLKQFLRASMPAVLFEAMIYD